MITIIDAGIGNFSAVANMLRHLEFEVEVCKHPDSIESITHLVLPGVGAFDPGVEGLQKSGWFDAILNLNPRVNILGICLGMQLFATKSEEGTKNGLGLIDATCRRFDNSKVRVPHLGWNQVTQVKNNRLLTNVTSDTRFYFSHSYYVDEFDLEVRTLETQYQVNFMAAFESKNLFGVQFHPEKSHKFGMEILKNFGNLPC
jgi:glutamine amidotransferase